jgi:YVTN family beta-propeller protein
MCARKHPRMRRASRFVCLAMILGMTVALTASVDTGPAQAGARGAARAPRVEAWTAYVANPVDNTVTPINTATNTPGTPITAKNFPDAIAITPNGTTAYVVTEDNTVTPINTATNTPGTPGTPIMVKGAPNTIAITPNGTTAYVVTVNSVTPIDLATNTAEAPITVALTPSAIAITPNGATAYVSDPSDNAVTPIDLATNTPGTPITVGSNPSEIAITPNGTTAYVSNAGGNIGTVTPIDLATNTAGPPITVGALPDAIAITPNGTTAYVVNEGQVPNSPGTVTPIDTATNTPGTPITVGNTPGGIAITPNGATAYVTNFGCAISRFMPTCPPPTPDDNSVTPIDTATNTAGTPISVGKNPTDIAITPDQAPVAHLSVTPAEAGQPTGFDASASTVAFGTITTFAWDFGDGSTATTSTPTTTHTYATPGPYTATVTETDSNGTSTTQVFTGQTMSNNGGPSAVASQNFTVVPPLTIATSSLPGGSVWSRTNKVTYSATLAATGGHPPDKWSLASGSSPLPPGLKLKKSTGVITGKATTAGTYSFTAQVIDTKMGKPKTQNTATATLSITIS